MLINGIYCNNFYFWHNIQYCAKVLGMCKFCLRIAKKETFLHFKKMSYKLEYASKNSIKSLFVVTTLHL